ncbi:restriction endonuclease PLD domain-containing protein [Taibaiella chishuiensis]|uniref:Phospholipase D-like protein n=1 Tax=Taibaiella chishuiensis TaxID=1434707 RepID=A0A2P8D0Z4_9BACT|nr:phospholipase D-like domain-containing protein [Taibaiella chishuiensis]PSK90836.1 phospholipase D-like protein [Taibaiella chishuiensis]
MLQFLSNSESSTHLDKVSELITLADEAYIMVAFLKTSGLKLIKEQLSKVKKFRVIAGANFGLTEPDALAELLKMAKDDNKAAYLNRMDSKQIFHPKLYMFVVKGKGHLIIGSANLTKGGLNNNNESSLYVQCSINDPVWKEAYAHFMNCVSPDNADILTDRIISIYREYYLKQKKIHDELDKIPDLSTNLFYDLNKLKSHFDSLDKKQIKKGITEKEKYYMQAKNVLDKIILKTHPIEEFKYLIEELVGKSKMIGLWYSNGMYRGKEKIFNQQEGFRKLVRNIKDNLHKSPGDIYEEAKEISKSIYRVGPNFIGEIMMTYAPEKLANINRNPITVLRDEGGVNLKSHSQSFNGADYEEYNSIVKEIAFKLGMKNMLAADYFFNEIYQEIKRKNKEVQFA